MIKVEALDRGPEEGQGWPGEGDGPTRNYWVCVDRRDLGGKDAVRSMNIDVLPQW